MPYSFNRYLHFEFFHSSIQKIDLLTNHQVHMLDLESFTYLNRALESPLSPLVILASNRGLTHIRGSSSLPPSAHGLPPDLLARLLIIPTHPYAPLEIRSIIRTRARTEGLAISDAALGKLGGLGEKVSLRYALQLMAPASVLARVGGKEGGEVGVEEITECEGLFLDAKRSAQVLGTNEGYIA
jgi:RuvB-like protein 1 (pontin 52)